MGTVSDQAVVRGVSALIHRVASAHRRRAYVATRRGTGHRSLQ